MKWWVVSICFIFSFIFFLFSGFNIQIPFFWIFSPYTWHFSYWFVHPFILSLFFLIIGFWSLMYFSSQKNTYYTPIETENSKETEEEKSTDSLKYIFSPFLEKTLPFIIFIASILLQVVFYSLYGLWDIFIVLIQLIYNISILFYTILLPYGSSFSSKHIKYTSIISWYILIIFSWIYTYINGLNMYILVFCVYGIFFNYFIHSRYQNILCFWWSIISLILFWYIVFLFFWELFL